MLAVASVATQEMKFFYPAPLPSSIEVTKDVPYGSLRLDLYRPAGDATGLPVLVFSNIASGAQRSHPFYKSWAEIAASQGLAAVLPDLRAETLRAGYGGAPRAPAGERVQPADRP
jgi:hypothetical protein